MTTLKTLTLNGIFLGFANSADKVQNVAFGIRHMLTLYEDHQVSYGIDYNFEKVNFGEEWPYLYPRWH